MTHPDPLKLYVNDLHYSYKNGTEVLKGTSFTASCGQLVSLIGKNGAGKSTLFKCILGLLRDYTGTITLGEQDMKQMPARQLAKAVAYIPQSHYPAFNYTVMDMVLMGSANQLSSVGTPGAREEEKAMAAIHQVGIDDLAGRGFAEISGGEQQLVLMARAILQDARVWILDEPLASLDYGNQIRVLKQLQLLAKEGYLILQSIHNPDQAYRYSDLILALKDGKVIRCGRPEEVMDPGLIFTLYGKEAEWIRPE